MDTKGFSSHAGGGGMLEQKMPSYHTTEKELYEWLKLSKNHRIVFNRVRKRKLEKRGERINFVIDSKCWIWVMEERT